MAIIGTNDTATVRVAVPPSGVTYQNIVDANTLGGQSGSYYANIPARLGFTPIQQGGGVGQGANKIYIGWDEVSSLRLQIDSADFGATWPINLNSASATAGGNLIWNAGNDIVLRSYTVATLPSGVNGKLAVAVDATAFGPARDAVSGGGGHTVLVMYFSGAWRIIA